MSWFDTPAISVRKQTPDQFHAGLNDVESFARRMLDRERSHVLPYQLGIVLAMWVKAGELASVIPLTPRASKRLQDIYASCVKTARSDSYQAFRVLEGLANHDQAFGMTPELYRRLAANVLSQG